MPDVNNGSLSGGELERISVSDTLALSEEFGLGVERFTPAEMERLVHISNAVIGISDKAELNKTSRRAVATFVTVFAVAEQFPQIAEGFSGLNDLDNVRTDDTELLHVLSDLRRLDVTDLSDYMPDPRLNALRFADTDDTTTELITTLSSIRDQIKDQQRLARGDEEVDYFGEEDANYEVSEEDEEDEADTEPTTVQVDGKEIVF